MPIAEGRRAAAPDRERAAAVMMAAGAVIISFFPVVAVYWGSSPLIFSAMLCVGTSGGLCAYVALAYRRFFFDARLWRLIWRWLFSWHIALWTIACADGALFVLAVGFVNAAVASALYQLSPLLIVLFIERLFAGKGRYERFGVYKSIYFALAGMGAAMVIVAEAGGFGGIDLDRARWTSLAIGCALAFGAAAVDGLSGGGFKWGVDVGRAARMLCPGSGNSEIYFTLVGSIICNGFVAIFLFGASALSGEAWRSDILIAGFIGGLAFGAAYTALWRMANLITSNLGVNIIRYFSVACSVVWMLALGLLEDVDIRLLCCGVGVIIIANVAIYLGRIRLYGLRRRIGARVGEVSE